MTWNNISKQQAETEKSSILTALTLKKYSALPLQSLRKTAGLRISKIFFLILTVLMLTNISLSAQMFDDFDRDSDLEYQVRGEKKSALPALLLSTVFPGSGHFYANRRSVGTFLFPIVEIGLWAGYFYFNNQGDEIEKDYMAYADEYYDRQRYRTVSEILMNHERSADLYNLDHFRLDDTNTQHFYEDIGKYNKYIFGWDDWYDRFVSDTGEVRWHFRDDGVWLGNYPVDADEWERPYSARRAIYIQMRRDAQENYSTSYMMSFGLALNRVVSSIDAFRVTNKYNRELRFSYDVNFKVTPMMTHSGFAPAVNLVVSY